MIEVIKVINTQFPNRIDTIYNSIFSNAAKHFPNEEKLKGIKAVFKEKNTIEHFLWIQENNIKIYPSTLFFKDEKMLFKKEGIMATSHIFKILQEIQYL